MHSGELADKLFILVKGEAVVVQFDGVSDPQEVHDLKTTAYSASRPSSADSVRTASIIDNN